MNSRLKNEDTTGRIVEENTEPTRPSTATVCVVGLGYVGLPLAVGFDRAGYDVIGYDIDPETVAALESGVDTTGDLGDEAIEGGDVTFTADSASIAEASFVLVTVPTPIDEDDRPQLDYVVAAGETIGEHMTPGTTIVLESTVYPGATREELVPALERRSGLTCGEDFFVGYSPERANPSDSEHGLQNVIKIVSGQNESVREEIATLYGHVVDAGIHRAPSIEVAESAKVVENVQRDLNIALVNELAMIFEELDLDTQAVLDAAGTKWNFHDYEPGLVSGHCIPVDPHFLAYRARREGYVPELIRTSRNINESVPHHVADLVMKALNGTEKPLKDSRVLVLGLAYKPDAGDIRSSKVGDVIDRLEEYDIDLVGYDPHASDETARNRFDIEVQESLSFEGFDGVLLATPHAEFEALRLEEVAEDLNDSPALVDVHGAFDQSDVPDELAYRRL